MKIFEKSESVAAVDALEDLKDSGINFTISHFFDMGWSFKLGDSANGYLDGIEVSSILEGVSWLMQTAEKHFPDAECFL
jgi:hypothetical protein